MIKANIGADVPAHIPDEITEVLVAATGVTIERIISWGHHSVEDFWYDQDCSEWVLLIQGEAGLTFADEPAPVELHAGDYINIPAHVRHRVAWTAEGRETIWLAVKY